MWQRRRQIFAGGFRAGLASVVVALPGIARDSPGPRERVATIARGGASFPCLNRAKAESPQPPFRPLFSGLYARP